MQITITIPDTPKGLTAEAYHRNAHPNYARDRAGWNVWKLARSYVAWVVMARDRNAYRRQKGEFMLGTYTWAELDIIRDVLTKKDAIYKGAPQKAVVEIWT